MNKEILFTIILNSQKSQKPLKSYQQVSFHYSLDELKAVYDYYGYDGLLNGVRDHDGNLKGGYKFSGESYKIFEKYFGTKNPYTLIKDTDRVNDEFGTMFGNAFGGLYNSFTDKPDDLEVELICSLEDLYNGAVKKLHYNKVTKMEGTRSTETREYTKDIEIEKGTAENTKKHFIGEGHQKHGYENGNF